jgi:predicted nucleic acid-binding Zn ribbon protein
MPVDFVAERRCPECGQESVDDWLPFCSEECRAAFAAATVRAGEVDGT